MKNYYYILGVHKGATIQEIKSAFRKLAIRLHPDKNAGDVFFEDRFRDIKEAYETLSDDRRKAQYDRRVGDFSDRLNDEAFKNYKEFLKKRYKEEIGRKEEDIKKRYLKLEQGFKEEAEKKRAAEEIKNRRERHRLLNEVEGCKRLLEQREQRLKVIRQKLSAAETEMTRVKKDAELRISAVSRSRTVISDKKGPLSLQEYPDILRELAKIKELIPKKELMVFLKMVLKYAETSSLSPKYGRDHPHLLKLIIKESIQMRPFKLFYAKHKNDPVMVSDFKGRLLQYFNIFPI